MRCLFGGSVSDAIVLHEGDFLPSTDVRQPGDVADRLVGRDAIALSKRREAQAIGSEKPRDHKAAETAVDEEVRQPVWM